MLKTKLSIIVLASLIALNSVTAVYHASREEGQSENTMMNVFTLLEMQYQAAKIEDFIQQQKRIEANAVDQISQEIQTSLKCKTCQAMSYSASSLVKIFKPMISELGVNFCNNFITFFGYKKEVCPGVIEDQFSESIIPMISDKLLNQQVLCSFILQICETDKWRPVDLDQWINNTLMAKPAEALSNDFVNKQYQGMAPKDKKDLIKIALLSDFHMDWDYTPGMSNDCQMPVCCRESSGLAASPDKAAGKWGDYQCDIPPITLRNLLSHIRQDVKPDAVFWGGDSIPHNIDSLSVKSNVEVMKNTTNMVIEELKGLKVFPTMGNHDTYPQDQIRVGGPGFEEAIKEWVPSWVHFVDGEESKETWLKFGYFAKQLTNKTRVISLNSNICYDANFNSWTAFNDSGNQLQWFQNQLSEIENQNGYAIILAHVPTLDECTRQYARRYHAIVDRYQHIIRFGMFSHVHSELYQVMRDINGGKEIGMNFIVGSVTTFQGKPPSYDLIYLDPETMLPVELETYAFDLETANKNDTTNWNLYLDYRKDYDMADLSPASFKKLSQRIHEDATVCQQYKVNTAVGGPQMEQVPCTEEQRQDYYCQTFSSDSDELFKCRAESKVSFFKKMIDWDKFLMSIINSINSQWYEPIKPASEVKM